MSVLPILPGIKRAHTFAHGERAGSPRKTPVPRQSARSRLVRTPVSSLPSRANSSTGPRQGGNKFNKPIELYQPPGGKRRLPPRFAAFDTIPSEIKGPIYEIDLDDEEEYDTDLEEENIEEKHETDGVSLYVRVCDQLGVPPISYYLRHMEDPEFKMLYRSMGPDSARALSVPMQRNLKMTNIDLSWNWIESTGAKAFAKTLQENYYITDMNLSNNKLGSAGVRLLYEAIRDSIFLRSVNLSGNEICSKDTKYLADILLTNTVLMEFNLSHNQIDDEGCLILAPAIATNDSLVSLDLSWNHIRTNGGVAISRAITDNISIQFLSLAMNGLASSGCVALAKALAENDTVEELDISSNRITTPGALEFAKLGLKKNRGLCLLKMGQNPITNQGAIGLLRAILENKEIPLRSFDLKDLVVEREFMDIVYEIKKERRIFTVKVGHVTQGKLLEGGEEQLADDNPLEVLLIFMTEKNLRLVDLFKAFDKDQSLSLTRDEFIQGLSSVHTPLSVDQMDTLIDMLDKDGDGEVDIVEILSVNKDYKDLKMKAKKKVAKERDERKRKKQQKDAMKNIVRFMEEGDHKEMVDSSAQTDDMEIADRKDDSESASPDFKLPKITLFTGKKRWDGLKDKLKGGGLSKFTKAAAKGEG